MNWYMKVMQEYFNVQGRARRKEYWMFFLVYLLIVMVAAVLGNLLNSPAATSVVALIHVVPAITVGVRRLHDIGRSGWWLLIGMVPVIGWIIALYWAVQPGDSGSNAYGPDPKALG